MTLKWCTDHTRHDYLARSLQHLDPRILACNPARSERNSLIRSSVVELPEILIKKIEKIKNYQNQGYLRSRVSRKNSKIFCAACSIYESNSLIYLEQRRHAAIF